MAYPRRCPICGTEHGTNGATDRGHVTIKAQSGGTASPWRPLLAGRILTLRCMTCAGEYDWDYFGNAAPPESATSVSETSRWRANGQA